VILSIKHENMAARRWPAITLILVNVVVFLCTYPAILDQEHSLWTVRAHVLVLAARHPELPPQAEQFVDDFQAHDRGPWPELQEPDSRPIGAWDARGVFGHSEGVAHWPHVGGFVFGALAAVALRQFGLEQKANQAIEQKTTWANDPAMTPGHRSGGKRQAG
jgi:hypothetical protein